LLPFGALRAPKRQPLNPPISGKPRKSHTDGSGDRVEPYRWSAIRVGLVPAEPWGGPPGAWPSRDLRAYRSILGPFGPLPVGPLPDTTGSQSGTIREPTGNQPGTGPGSRLVPGWFPIGSWLCPARAQRPPTSCGRPVSRGLTTGASPGPREALGGPPRPPERPPWPQTNHKSRPELGQVQGARTTSLLTRPSLGWGCSCPPPVTVRKKRRGSGGRDCAIKM
jgi:hypothetical protein